MNNLVDTYFESLRGKRIAVLGIGVSNRPLIALLLSYGLQMTACDKTPRADLDPEILQLEAAGAVLRVGEGYLDDLQADVVFRTPGMHPNIPALCKLRAAGAVITSEMEAFFAVCPCKIIAVTGSDGKTTTTTLIAEILKQAGKTVWLGGNIGTPLLPNASQMRPDDIAVVELSSFQLMHMTQSPEIAVVTNLAPNHLDVHKDMDEYVEAKTNIFRHQKPGQRVVLNLDNALTASFAEAAPGYVIGFSSQTSLQRGAWLKDGIVFHNGNAVMKQDDILLPGLHNVENYLAAICAVEGYATDGDVLAVAKRFEGVEHRMEFVRQLHGVRYYNDSIASSPTRTIAGLRAFERKVILIAGGYDKQIPFDALGSEIASHVKHLVLCGATAEKIEHAVVHAENYTPNHPAISTVETLQDAVTLAYDISEPGDVVTLSPACAAFDQFKNFMVRGAAFKKMIWALEEKTDAE